MAFVSTMGLTGCSALVREADFVGAPDLVTEATLLGPFDGQVLDVTTGEPIGGATVVGVWTFDDGEGLSAPAGSEVYETQTDAAGRYHVDSLTSELAHAGRRLLDFDLFVYKRGYVGYRSDAAFGGGRRSDFAMRHHRIELRKWRESDSHAEHLLYLDGPPSLMKHARWERSAANTDLYRRLTGQAVEQDPEQAEQPAQRDALQLLDATALLKPEDIRRRTGSTDVFTVKELGDLARTHFYHGVHLQAVDREETWDVAYRVWKSPPGGLATVVETFEATLPDVKPEPLITEETWVYDSPDIRAVAFIDRERELGVLLTCGAKQCIDIETTIILAKHLYENLGQLKTVDAPAGGQTSPTPATAGDPATSAGTPTPLEPDENAAEAPEETP